MSNTGMEGVIEETRGTKRKQNSFQNVDIDTGNDLPSSKRRNTVLDEEVKVNVLRALAEAYTSFLKAFFGEMSAGAFYNLNISNQITSIMMTLHNIGRQRVNNPNDTPPMETKARQKSFTVNYEGAATMTFEEAKKIWECTLRKYSLVYKKFDKEDTKNWIGTMSPYLSYHSGFNLRMKELRMGHGKIITGKTNDGTPKGTPVSALGLNGAHHVLLEGISYNPERKTAMAQSLGPMTVFIQMLRTTDPKYRKKWEDAVKAQMGSIAVIDDIIQVTRGHKRITDFAPIITLLAEILLISTSRQISRMFFPIAMLAHACLTIEDEKGDVVAFLKRFNVSSHGGYHLYDIACEAQWFLNGNMEDSQAAQIVFHSIFGTYREDLGVLEQITTAKRWYTREELGPAFRQGGDGQKRVASFSLPRFINYSKLGSSNLNTALAGVYEQVTYSPVFAGKRDHKFSDDFFSHIQKQSVKQSVGKTLAQIETALSETLMELREMATSGRLDTEWGTVKWFPMSSVETNSSKTGEGELPDFKTVPRNRYFMSKARK